MKTTSIKKYMCEVCEKDYGHDYMAMNCEKLHDKLAKIMKIGAKVTWWEDCADRGSSYVGTVVGFDRDGSLVVEPDFKYKDLKNTRILDVGRLGLPEKKS